VDSTSETHPSCNREEVYITWNVPWPVDRYIDHYLEVRKYPRDEEWRCAVRESLALFPGTGALRKTDVDFYLDATASRWAPVFPTR
jgi:hypothetical protein